MKKLVVDVIKKALDKKGIKLKGEEIEAKIEIPPSIEMGDYSFPCFFLAEKLKDSPHQISLDIREEIGSPDETDFDDIQVQGPYINFFIDRKNLARKVVWEVINQKKSYGISKIGKGKRIVVEFSSPNIAKPFGIGHLRSTIIGNSIANISEFLGYNVTRINYIGDWGTQFGKVLFGYEKFGKEKKLMENPMKHLFEIYVKANKKVYDPKSREWFKKLEDHDKKALMLWKLFRNLSLKEFEKVYKDLGIVFDEYDGESMHHKGMKEVVKELNEKNLVKKSKGAMIIDLKGNLGVCLIQKSDGATLYATRELAAAIARYKKYKFEKMIYEVGQEQTLHFKQIFKILELMGYKWTANCVHVDHGLYLDKNGKKLSTRKGKTYFMEDVLEETISLAKKEITKRDSKISKNELERRAHKIAIAAIFYGDLKNSRRNNIIFDINKFVSFEGDTGPYIQYSYARATSILTKAPSLQKKFEINELDKKELELVQKISQFQETVVNAFNTMSPSLIANYSYQLAQIFNEFYHECPVIGSENEAFRLSLVEAFRQVLKNALKLLGIETLEEM